MLQYSATAAELPDLHLKCSHSLTRSHSQQLEGYVRGRVLKAQQAGDGRKKTSASQWPEGRLQACQTSTCQRQI